MAKKVKNPKLSKPSSSKIKKPQKSAFGKHAQKLVNRKLKNRQNKTDAVQRMMKQMKKNKKAQIKMIKNKKKSRFDLDDQGDNFQNYKLKHKGMEVEKIDDFEEAGIASDEDMEEEYVENFHFDGFDNEGEQDGKDQNKHKSKKQVYEQIIAKSKLYKEAKQRQLEQNFEAAVELDNEFPSFVQNLKFINNKVKMPGQERTFEKMMNQLRDEPKALIQKTVKPDVKKEQSKRKMKRMQYIKQLQKQDDEEDIRGWVKGVNGQEDYDELDDVNLSGEDEDDDEDEQGDEDEGQYDDDDLDQEDGEDQEDYGDQQEQGQDEEEEL